MTGIVLIGGRSTRFGSDKVVSPFKGKSLVEHVVDLITPLFDDVILIGNRRPELDAFHVVEDILPGAGPLGGVYTALLSAGTPQCFVFAADMPNLNRGFIKHMIAEARDHDIVIPLWKNGREPLHAIYHRRVLPMVEDLIRKKSLKIFNLLQGADTLVIPEEEIRRFADPEIIFSNINTTLDRDRLS
jgi:molybdopterin-guanine dinucleotide biosynthesis protein A